MFYGSSCGSSAGTTEKSACREGCWTQGATEGTTLNPYIENCRSERTAAVSLGILDLKHLNWLLLYGASDIL